VRAGATTARIGAAVVVVMAVLTAAGVHLVAEGRSELAASDAAWKKGDGIGAAVHARSAARAYVPGASHMDLGYERLRIVAQTSERKGDVEAALFAWRAFLSAATGSRPFGAARGEDRAAAEASVARLSAALSAAGRTPSGGRRAPAVESPVTAELVPRAGWGVLFLGGAALFFGAGARLASRGWGRDGRPVPAEVRVAVVMAVAGFAAWLACLLLA
jgi:hypothetical protein